MNKKGNDSGKEKQRDHDLVAAEIAMERAAKKAHERARQTGAGIIVLKDGLIVEERQGTESA